MDIGKSFGYVFDDDEWITKILIAAVILLLGILFFWVLFIPSIVAGLLLGGYGVEITRRVIRGDSQVLPRWDNWGELLMDGLKAWIIELVFGLPIIVLSVCLGPASGILAEDAQELSALLSACLGGFNVLWGIVVGLFLPAAIAMFVAEEEVSAAFRFGDVFALVRDNFVTYLLVLVIGWVASLIGGLGLLVCGVGVLVTAPYAGWITAHLRGQAYLEAKGLTPQPALEEEVA
jgi:hypothetical protein